MKQHKRIYKTISMNFPVIKKLRIPISESEILNLKLGEVVFFDGTIFTGREKVLCRLIDENIVPIDIKNACNAMMTSAPGVKQIAPNRFEVIAAMPTTNYRFIKWLPSLFEKHGLRVLISKGGLQRDSYQLFKKYNAVNVMMVTPAITATYAKGIIKVRQVFWEEEFRTTDALYVFEIENFGPFIVEGDSQGNSLFKDVVNPLINEKIRKAYENLPELTQSRVGDFKASKLNGELYM